MKRQFGIRDLLWLMVVVGLASGWLIDRRNKQAEIDEMIRKMDLGEFSLYVEGGKLRYVPEKSRPRKWWTP